MNINRLFIIDSCLRDKSRTWSLQDLIDQCGETMRNSKRSIQGDLELMRKHFKAPIIVQDRKYYMYGDSDYSLAKIKLEKSERETMLDLVESLRQFCRFEEAQHLLNDINKMGDKVADAMGMPRLAKQSHVAAKQDVDIRFWVDSEYVEHILQHPIHPTQQIEQYEFDGSANFVIHSVLNAKLVAWAESYKGKVLIKE